MWRNLHHKIQHSCIGIFWERSPIIVIISNDSNFHFTLEKYHVGECYYVIDNNNISRFYMRLFCGNLCMFDFVCLVKNFIPEFSLTLIH